MGWFDNEKQRDTPPDVAARSERRPPDDRPEPEPRSAPSPGSTLGERVHVDGTIVSREDLTVVGRVEGTIRAERALRIAEGARVDAVIRGSRVLVQGTVTGDIEGTEAVVLGPTASVTGDIQTPSLEIHDGGFFKGKVDMKSARKAAAEAKAAKGDVSGKAAGSKKAGVPGAKESDTDRESPRSESPEGNPGRAAGTVEGNRKASTSPVRSTEAVKSS